ncbi:MAG: N-acetyltransferase [Rhodobacteraceae bacterium]|nr:N-acetyltransferase [Paracoccaceae bacterium]MCB2141870.1 N-acetyltransferase [Paracoccaceae bacterium]MCP5323131.1 N-acetyltransferase [Paracoccaceae bacterium]MCP5354336.1 N-acetyltransferase [Paracoccaceae bacterium]MCP5375927.1 N-acetyltransferase [Paracoccaceae bacterium]
MPDGTGAEIEVSLLTGFSAVAPQDWDSCACPEAAAGRPVDPFTTHRFLLALERSGSVGPGTGWDPRPLVARAEGRVVAVAPLFVKSHSQGEYIFDHGWADALERAGGRYYPKLQIAVPFTPATGRRFLTAPGWETAGRAALVEGAVQVAAQARLSSVHVTFCTEAEATAGEAMGLLHRVTQQYHWENRGYADFGDFLAALSSRKRKTIRKEREVAQGFGGTIRRLTGGDIRPEHWDAFWRFYQDTGSRKWGRPYLTRAFFDELHETMRDDVLLVLAERGGRPVAGALNLIGRDTLFGRYWGAVEDHPCLHFECCYYQAIDFAIERRMARVEAGAQGEHKLARGYLPSKIHSLHWIGEPSFRDAVARYLRAEGDAVGQEIAALADYGPFRKES